MAKCQNKKCRPAAGGQRTPQNFNERLRISMDVPEFQWMSQNLNGRLRISMDVSEFQWTSQNLHAWDKATNHMLRQDPELNAWRRPQTHDQGRPQHVIGPSP